MPTVREKEPCSLAVQAGCLSQKPKPHWSTLGKIPMVIQPDWFSNVMGSWEPRNKPKRFVSYFSFCLTDITRRDLRSAIMPKAKTNTKTYPEQ
jgi:hypothetical protein